MKIKTYDETFLPGGNFMNITLTRKSFYCLLIFFVTSCITINIYFPAAAVEKAADIIVDEVWGNQGGKPGEEDDTGNRYQRYPDTRQYGAFYCVAYIASN